MVQKWQADAASVLQHSAFPPLESQDIQEQTAATAAHSEARTVVPRRPVTAGADMDLLREEAAQESRIRAQESGGAALETQPDLGLDDNAVADRAVEARRRIRRPMAAQTERPAPRPPAPETASDTLPPPPEDPQVSPQPPRASTGSRRDLLPDIEEINSTLRPDAKALASAADQSNGDPIAENAARGRGIRRGFAVMVALTTLAVVIYSQADAIGQRAPSVQPALASYSTWVNERRKQLDETVSAIADRLSDAAASAERNRNRLIEEE